MQALEGLKDQARVRSTWMELGRLVRYPPVMDRPRILKRELSRREQLLALAGAIPGAWLTAGSQAQAVQPEAGAASGPGVRLPLPGAVARPLADYLQDRPISVRDFGAVGDYDPTTVSKLDLPLVLFVWLGREVKQ